jgi:hypothetical protein
MNTRNQERESSSDGFEPLRPLKRTTRATVMSWTETADWPECPADGKACERSDGDCEVCGRSALTY